MKENWAYFMSFSGNRISGFLLEEGDTLEKDDMYTSSNGMWQPCPCSGLTLGKQSSDVLWVRPNKEG